MHKLRIGDYGFPTSAPTNQYGWAQGYELHIGPTGNLEWFDPNNSLLNPISATWYKANTTISPDTISDDIYTNGKVGINNQNPQYNLDINGNIGFKPWSGVSDSVGIFFNANSDDALIRFVAHPDISSGNAYLEIATGDNGNEPIIFS